MKGQLDKLVSQSDGTAESLWYEVATIKLFAERNGLDANKLLESYVPEGDDSWHENPEK